MRKSRPKTGYDEGELYRFIGSRIRDLRGATTQEELAKQIGVTPNTLSRWETAVYKPSPAELDQLARHFNVGIWAFFPSSERPPAEAQRALLSATGDLPAKDLKELERYADFIRARKRLSRKTGKRP